MSLSAAYAIHKRNKMAHGGTVSAEKETAESPAEEPAGVLCMKCGGEVNPEASHMNEGGEVEESFDDDSLDLLSEPMPLDESEAKNSKILSRIFGSKKSKAI